MCFFKAEVIFRRHYKGKTSIDCGLSDEEVSIQQLIGELGADVSSPQIIHQYIGTQTNFNDEVRDAYLGKKNTINNHNK